MTFSTKRKLKRFLDYTFKAVRIARDLAWLVDHACELLEL